MIRRSISRRLNLVAIVLAVSLVACGGGGDDSPSAPTATPPVSSPAWLGTVAARDGAPSPIGLKWDLARASRFAPFLGQLAGGATFYELVWCDVERQRGTVDWSTPDEAVSTALELGFRMKLKLRVGSCETTGGQVGTPRGRRQKTASRAPLDTAAYEQFVRDAVERYAPQGVHDYALENEVNGPNLWADSPDAYEALVKRAANVVRDVDPAARVFDSGLSSTAWGHVLAQHLLDEGAEDEAVEAYMQYYERRLGTRDELPRVSTPSELRDALAEESATRSLRFADVVFRLADEGVIDAFQLHFYESSAAIDPLIDLLRDRLPTDMTIEAWEAGIFWPEGDVDDLASEAAKLVTALIGRGVAQVIYLPTAFSEGGRHDSEVRWGLLDPAGRPRDAAVVYTALGRALADGADVRLVHRGETVALAVGREQGAIVLAWSSGRATIAGPEPVGVSAADLFGSKVAWHDDGLPLGADVTVIDVPGGLAAAMELLQR